MRREVETRVMENIQDDISSGDDEESLNDVEEVCVTMFESMEMEAGAGYKPGTEDVGAESMMVTNTDTNRHSGGDRHSSECLWLLLKLVVKEVTISND